ARDFRGFRQRYANSHPELLEKIVDLAWKRAVREGNGDLLDDLIRANFAPALDPHWNRAWALYEEGAGPYGAERVKKHWRAFANDVQSLPDLREEERSIAAALVYLRLAR